MAKPPADADPEKFIVGRGAYDNLQIARPYADEHVFRIDPVPMPVRSMIVYNLVFAAFFYGFHWVLKHLTQGEAGPWAVYGAPIGIGLMTCGVFTAVVYHSFAKACRLGAAVKEFVTRDGTDHSSVETRVESVMQQLDAGLVELQLDGETDMYNVLPVGDGANLPTDDGSEGRRE